MLLGCLFFFHATSVFLSSKTCKLGYCQSPLNHQTLRKKKIMNATTFSFEIILGYCLIYVAKIHPNQLLSFSSHLRLFVSFSPNVAHVPFQNSSHPHLGITKFLIIIFLPLFKIQALGENWKVGIQYSALFEWILCCVSTQREGKKGKIISHETYWSKHQFYLWNISHGVDFEIDTVLSNTYMCS